MRSLFNIFYHISIEEEDFREINNSDKKQFRIDRNIPNSSSSTQKDDMQSGKSHLDKVNQSKEQGPENASGISNVYSIIKD